MAYYAYRDKDRKKIVYANECTNEDIGIDFFCRNPNCKARMRIRALNGDTSPYFAALPSPPNPPHLNAWCGSMHIEESKRCNGKNIDLDAFFENLKNKDYDLAPILPGNGVGKMPANSKMVETEMLSKIYAKCKSLPPDSQLGKYKVYELLVDCESNFYYTKGIWGRHLIECFFYRYDETKQVISFKYPLDGNLPNRYYVNIHIPDIQLFKKTVRLVFAKKGSEQFPVVLCGDWKYSFGNCFATVISELQVYCPDFKMYR